jgi:drug/metabolite transporter (DMT)-like permease
LRCSLQLLSLPIILVALLTMGKLFNPFSLGPRFWLPMVAIWLGFYPLNTYFYVNAVKHGEISKILPLQSFGPIFGMLLGWILIGQRPSLLAALGILIVVCGVYVLNLKGKYLHNPLKVFTTDKANLLIMGSLLLSTVAAVLDVVIIKASEPIYAAFVDTLGAVVVLYITSLLLGVKEPDAVKENIKSLSIAGFTYGGTFVAYLLALNISSLAYVSTVRTSGIIVGSALIGWYLKESITKIKLIALALIILGSIILGLN